MLGLVILKSLLVTAAILAVAGAVIARIITETDKAKREFEDHIGARYPDGWRQ